MRVLVIEDTDYKFKKISESLEKLIDEVVIERAESYVSGLASIYVRNVNNVYIPFDMIVCDDLLPLEDDGYDLMPFASKIVEEINNLGLEIPTIVCSSDELIDCDYFINYNPNKNLDHSFITVFGDLVEKKKI